jgi:hypothetical protein
MGKEPPRSFKELGTKKYPLHASGLDLLLACPWFWTGRLFMLMDDSAGEPAHTGTAAGRVIELWHAGLELKKALQQAQVESIGGERPFPLADFARVEALSAAYTADPRNERANVLQCEGRVLGEPVPGLWVSGYFDQLRRFDTSRRIWDLKAGQRPEPHEHACQLAAYALLTNAEVGGIIRLQDYLMKAGVGPVFRGIDLPRSSCVTLMESVRAEVERLRRGEVYPRPCAACRWCGWGGLEECLKKLGGKR